MVTVKRYGAFPALLVFIIVAAALLLAGCGAGSDRGKEAQDATAQKEQEAAGEEQGDQPGEAARGDQAGGAANGNAAVEDNATDGDNAAPTIVVTYFPYADHIIALGQAGQLKGAVNLKSLQTFPVYEPYLQDGAIADLGEQVAPEQIMALEPDLVIISQNEAQYEEQLSKFARTVTVEATLNWQETMRAVAIAIGAEEEAEQYIAQFLALQEETAAMMQQSGAAGKTALFMMPWKESFTHWGGSRMALYYEKLGFKPFEGMANVGQINLEGVSEYNPDYIFIGKDFSNTSEVRLEELAANPVWNALDAVKNERAFVVDTEILGPLAMGQFKGLEYMNQLFGGASE